MIGQYAPLPYFHAFLTLPALSREEMWTQARRIQRRVRRRQGLPIRLGIGPTKTLAKVADERAKGSEDRCYVCPDGEALAAVLNSLPVGDVWGIGPAYTSHLNEHGVETAEAFRQLPDAWIRRHLSVVGLRLATELRGTPCLALEAAPLRPATNHTPTLLHTAGTLLRAIYREGPAYKKAGVTLQALRPEGTRQGDLFRQQSETDDALMAAVDRLNRTMGRDTVGFAAAGVSGTRDWTMKRGMRSPHYTTRWSDLPVARA